MVNQNTVNRLGKRAEKLMDKAHRLMIEALVFDVLALVFFGIAIWLNRPLLVIGATVAFLAGTVWAHRAQELKHKAELIIAELVGMHQAASAIGKTLEGIFHDRRSDKED